MRATDYEPTKRAMVLFVMLQTAKHTESGYPHPSSLVQDFCRHCQQQLGPEAPFASEGNFSSARQTDKTAHVNIIEITALGLTEYRLLKQATLQLHQKQNISLAP